MLPDFVKRALDRLDCSYAFVAHQKGRVCLALVAVCFLSVVWYVVRRYRGGSNDKITQVVKYLLSSSARHVESAVSLRNSHPMQALEHAIYGNVMATTAKDLVDDKKELSRALNVDVFAYLDYTNQVLSRVKQTK